MVIVAKAEIVKGRVIRGIEALDWFAELGGVFVLEYPRSKIPIEEDWVNKPRPLVVARAHVEDGGNVALLTGAASANLVFIDVDADFAKFCVRFPWVCTTPTVAVIGATDRARPLIRMVNHLPPNRAYCPEPKKPPVCEILSTGRKGSIPPSFNPDAKGYYEIRHAERPVLEMSLEQLEKVWKRWTGVDLVPIPSRPQTHAPGPSGHFRTVDGLVDQVKAAWPSALLVFEHHGFQVKRHSPSQRWAWGLGENGYIVAGEGEYAPLWYDFSQLLGGDVFDAWFYCTRGQIWDRSDRTAFAEVLREMAEAAGIDPDGQNEFKHRLEAYKKEQQRRG